MWEWEKTPCGGSYSIKMARNLSGAIAGANIPTPKKLCFGGLVPFSLTRSLYTYTVVSIRAGRLGCKAISAASTGGCLGVRPVLAPDQQARNDDFWPI